jgi:hypothetical protein
MREIGRRVDRNDGREVQELGDDVVALLDTRTAKIENLELLLVSTPLLRSDMFGLSIPADLRRAV